MDDPLASFDSRAAQGPTTRSHVAARWQETWQLAAVPGPEDLFARLVSRYAEPHRAYHDLRHILACLDLARTLRAELNAPAEVELALWYHDAIYEPRAGDNEERSAAFAEVELAMLPEAVRDRIGALVLATKHAGDPASNDARFVVDIDLAVLGGPAEAFDDYESAIRREYRWVPGPIFRRKRREILRTFLDRPRIYSTEPFYRQLEAPARSNLERSIRQLE